MADFWENEIQSFGKRSWLANENFIQSCEEKKPQGHVLGDGVFTRVTRGDRDKKHDLSVIKNKTCVQHDSGTELE